MTTIKTFFSQIRFFFQIFEKEHGRPPPSLSLLWLPTMCNRTSRAQVYCFHDYIYITDILLLWDLSTLCVVDHLWPLIWPHKYITYIILYYILLYYITLYYITCYMYCIYIMYYHIRCYYIVIINILHVISIIYLMVCTLEDFLEVAIENLPEWE